MNERLHYWIVKVDKMEIEIVASNCEVLDSGLLLLTGSDNGTVGAFRTWDAVWLVWQRTGPGPA